MNTHSTGSVINLSPDFKFVNMRIWNGQYSLDNITDLEMLKQLYREALDMAVDAKCHVKDEHYMRIHDSTITPKEWIEKYLNLNTHNVVFNRYIYKSKRDWAAKEAEIGSCTMGLEYDKLLWIYVSLEDLEILVKKYRLQKL